MIKTMKHRKIILMLSIAGLVLIGYLSISQTVAKQIIKTNPARTTITTVDDWQLIVDYPKDQ